MSYIRNLSLALLCLPALFVAHPVLAEPVNINTADAASLARELVGIGETRARAIIEYRTQHGPFRSVEELALVKGIGPRVIEQNRANLRVESARAADRRTAVPATTPRGKPAPAAGGRATTGASAGSRPAPSPGR